MLLRNKTDEYIISSNLIIANTYFNRLKGLMFSKTMPSENALLLKPCNQIHTFFMKYAIDVLYIDRNNSIVEIHEKVEPGKILERIQEAVIVIELPVGRVKEKGIIKGKTVEFL